MGKLHRDNAGYIGCSHEETQDPYYSYNKLSLPLSGATETVIRSEKTFAVTVQQVSSVNKYFIDGAQQAELSLKQGEVYTFDLSDSTVATHPFRLKKNPVVGANSLTNGLPTGYDATSTGLYSGTLSNIESDDGNYIQATSSHIYFDLGADKKIHNFIAKWTSYTTDSSSADYRIALYSDSGFTTLLAASSSASSENTSDVVTVDHDFGGIEARYVSWEYVGGGRVGRLRYFYPYVDTSDIVLTTSGTQGQSGATAKYVVPFGTLGSYEYYCASHAGMGANVSVSANAGMFTGALPVLKTTDQFGATLESPSILFGYDNSDNSFDSSATSLTKDVTGYTFNAWSGSVLESSLGGSGANSAQVVKASDGSSVTWVVSTDSTDRRLWTSSNGTDWTSSGSNYDTDGSYVAITSVWLAWAGGANVSTTYVASAPEVAPDPYATNLVLALPMNGSNGGTTFTDQSAAIKGSGSAKTITLYSGSSTGGAVTSTDQSNYYGSSFYVVRGGVNANASDYITRTGDTDLSFGTGDFTVEFWFYPTSLVSNYVIFDNRHPTTGWPSSSNGFSVYGNSSGTIHFYSGGSNVISADYAIQNQANQWHHFAVIRNNGRTSLLINGETKGSVFDSRDYNQDRFVLGSSAPNGEGTSGYFNDLRIYKGVAKYKANFSPVSTLSVTDLSSSAHSVTNNGSSFQTSVQKFYGGAAATNSGYKVIQVTSDDFNVGTGDFTLEFWAYSTDSANDTVYRRFISTNTNSTNAIQIGHIGSNTGRIRYTHSDNGNYAFGPDVDCRNRWVHVAAVRESGVVSLYVDGQRGATLADANAKTQTTLWVSGYSNTQGAMAGYIQDIKFYANSSKYTSSFSPPERSIQGTARRYPSGVYVVS